MAKRPLSDEERAARARRELGIRTRWRAVWVFIIGTALLFAAVAALSFTGHAALVLSLWGQTITAVYGCALLVYFIVTLSRSYDLSSIETDDPRFMRRQIDVHQRNWRWMILLQVFAMLPFFAELPLVFQVFGASPFMRAVVVLMIFALTIGFAFLLLAGPGLQSASLPGGQELLNDEFVTDLRARATRFGYILTMLLLGGVLVIVLWWPGLTLRAVSWALYTGFALPALYYVIADWRAAAENAERDD